MEGRSTVYNRITSPEKIAQINPKNKELSKDFLDYLSSIDRSPQTLSQYSHDLNVFFVWVLENLDNKDFIKITKREFARFQNYALNTYQWSPKRLRRIKSVISSLSNFIENMLDEEDEYADYKSVIRKIESPANEPVREKTIMTDEQLELLLNTLVENGDYEKACGAAVLAYSGMRKAELLQLKIEYFTPEHLEFGCVYVTDKVRAKGRGKNGKSIRKYVLNKVDKYIELWKNQREKLGIDSEWLFVIKHGDTWDRRTSIDYWKEEFSEIIGVPYYFHMNRHYCCSMMLGDYNLPPDVVREWNGWNDLSLLQVYNDRSAFDDFGKYFSADGIIAQEQKGLSDIK